MFFLSVQPFLPSAMTTSTHSSNSATMRSLVPSCNTNRSVAERSGELFTEIADDITTASSSVRISLREDIANAVVAAKSSSEHNAP